MPESPMKLVRQCAEYRSKDCVRLLPKKLRGIYVLYKENHVKGRQKFDVQYVGMAASGRRGGLRSRLISHTRSKRKKKFWTHFSAYVVWDNIRDEEVAELEGLFRHIYRKDSAASSLNLQRGFKKVRRVRENNIKKWPLLNRMA
jgi:hypothetical protein